MKLPFWLVHPALAAQPAVPRVHSLMSMSHAGPSCLQHDDLRCQKLRVSPLRAAPRAHLQMPAFVDVNGAC